jgi:hypothetical protein
LQNREWRRRRCEDGDEEHGDDQNIEGEEEDTGDEDGEEDAAELEEAEGDKVEPGDSSRWRTPATPATPPERMVEKLRTEKRKRRVTWEI